MMSSRNLFCRALLLAVSLAFLVVPGTAVADSIVGNFSIAGGDSFDASQITFTNPAFLLSSTLPGIYGQLDNGMIQKVAFTSFLYANAVGTQLFTLTQNDVTVTFGIYQDSFVYTPGAPATPTTLDVNPSLVIQGFGYLAETGYTTTSAAFSLTTSQTGAISFQVVGNSPASPTIPGVAPEPCSLILLGTGMLGISGVLVQRPRAQVL